jgi:predicted enzyme related to lactoylglutathione lyase
VVGAAPVRGLTPTASDLRFCPTCRVRGTRRPRREWYHWTVELENVTLDAADPGRLGRFWEDLVGGRRLTDEPDLVEIRLSPPGAPVVDLCLPRVPEPVPPRPRLHLDLRGGDEQDEVVARALELGARHLDIGQGGVPWVVLADPEGNPFCVMEDRPEYRASGPVAALPLDCTDLRRDLPFWQAASGWEPAESSMPAALRHPDGRGPLLELCPTTTPKDPGTKNRMHLDTRCAPGEELDDAVARLVALGGREVDPGWGDLPWRVLVDPSGNELCVLPGRPA